jgi:carboxypeptidase Q
MAQDRFTVRAARTLATTALVWLSLSPAAAQSGLADRYRAPVARIIAEATAERTATEAWNRVAELSDKYPGRLSGSASLEAAIAWASTRMAQDGLDDVRVDPVKVPHWVRGAESAAVLGPYAQPLAIAALGGSIGTSAEGVVAPVLVVRNFAELDARAAEAKGKIVVYNIPYDETIDALVAYRQGTQYRGSGASRAAAHGAVGALVRSVGPVGHRTPHTGGMRYADGVPQVPVAGLAAEDANMLQRMQDRGEPATIRLTLGARMLPDTESGNVIGELRGRDKPDEIVLLGCHLDSWDISPGAMDDGGGCIAMWEAVRVIKRLGLRPRRTLRVVLFTNEENGGRGGQAYRDKYAASLARHVLAMESDDGVLPIRAYGFAGTEAARATMAQITTLLAPLGGTTVHDKFAGADITPIIRATNVPALSPDPEMRRYFYIHHTSADTVDKIVPAELAKVIAAMASVAFVAADMEDALPRAGATP